MKKSYDLSLREHPDEVWPLLRAEAAEASGDPALTGWIAALVLGRGGFADALEHVVAEALAGPHLDAAHIRAIAAEAYAASPDIIAAAQHDLAAIMERDPAATSLLTPFLFFKGFHALQSYRVAHWLWENGRPTLALALQSLIAARLNVDIHPAAAIGQGVMMDHAGGIVIGETAVVEDNVSLLHNVTLGGTGKATGARHPTIRHGVMIGAGATILGAIEVGVSARVAAGSVVLANVPPGAVVAGVPARLIGNAQGNPAELMDQTLPPPDFQI